MNSTLLMPRPTDRPPREERWGAGATLSLIAHAGLVAALAWSVNWHTVESAGVEAELWASVPEAAAPPAASEAAQQKPDPAPAPAPAPVAAPPEPAPPRAADIATERADAQRREREQEAQRDAQKKEQARQDRQAQLDQQRADAAKKKLEEARLQQLRDENLKRIMGQAGSTSASPESLGTAARTAGPSASYAGRIIARVRPNIVLTDPINANPAAEVEVHLAPDGSITSRRITRASGVREWDEAVLRAIDRTGVMPRDVDGRVPASITIIFRPGE